MASSSFFSLTTESERMWSYGQSLESRSLEFSGETYRFSGGGQLSARKDGRKAIPGTIIEVHPISHESHSLIQISAPLLRPSVVHVVHARSDAGMLCRRGSFYEPLFLSCFAEDFFVAWISVFAAGALL